MSEAAYANDMAIYPDNGKVIYTAEVQNFATKPYSLLCYTDFGVLDAEKEAEVIKIDNNAVDIQDESVVKLFLPL